MNARASTLNPVRNADRPGFGSGELPGPRSGSGTPGRLLAAAAVCGCLCAAHAQSNTVFIETYDTTNTPAGASAPGWSGGAGLANVVVSYVNSSGVSGSRAVVIQADFTQANSGYVAYQYANTALFGNTSPKLADYQLAFDIKVNNSGLSAIQCVLVSWGNTGYGGTQTATPTGSIPLGTYTPGTFKRISVSLADTSIWPGANPFNPAGGTCQIQLQVNGWNGAAVHVGEQVTIDNLTLTMTAGPGQCTVDWNDIRQRIDGFGASSAWDSTWTTAEADLLFSTNTGIGLSLLRNRIAPDGTTWETSLMQMAQARGARVWSAPWSPPVAYKDSGTVNGGNFVSSAANYQNYANLLASYVASMKNSYGVNLHALSIQNEPNFSTTNYESCVWTGQQLHDFIPYLAAAMTNYGVASTRIMIPEDMHWQFNLATNSLNDPVTSNLVGVLAAHNYGSAAAPVTAFGNPCPKPLWETEVYFGSDDTITNGVALAVQVHAFMTVAQANAFHYWWLLGSGNGSLVGNSTANPAKRAYVMGNYSRFVRPNYYRLGVSNNNGATLVSAYKDPASGTFAVVAANATTTSISQTFQLTNFTAASLIPWITASNLSLASNAPVAITGSSLVYLLPAMSVVTFVGQQSNTTPTLSPIADQTINAGVTLSITNMATDPNVPPQVLTFSLPSAPTNATLTPVNATNAVFGWRPLVSQADTTNLITVRVTDNGTPASSAARSFTVTVNPLPQPIVSQVTIAGNQASLVVTGAIGPDYTLLASTNLANWQILATTNPSATPFVMVDADCGVFPARFYLIQLGP
jgi:glucuronoarabinoxylan endo-1,4-beta-xylanase